MSRDGDREPDESRDGRHQEREEYADWTPPGQSATGSEAEGAPAETETDDDWGPPPEIREPLLRDRFREALGVTARQWFVIETLLLVAPYPVFVAVYFAFDVDQTLFLLVTLAYSLVAMYVGFLS